jgi:hypothetical protein
MENLQLSLKTKWFEMTKAGLKTEDYREINCYWAKRLVYNLKDLLLFRRITSFVSDKEAHEFLVRAKGSYGYKDFKTNTVTLGYPKANDTERILKLEHKGIEIRTGNPEWGAEPDKLYFVIKHGTILHES